MQFKLFKLFQWSAEHENDSSTSLSEGEAVSDYRSITSDKPQLDQPDAEKPAEDQQIDPRLLTFDQFNE